MSSLAVAKEAATKQLSEKERRRRRDAIRSRIAEVAEAQERLRTLREQFATAVAEDHLARCVEGHAVAGNEATMALSGEICKLEGQLHHTTTQTLLNELGRPPLADPGLLKQLFIAKRTLEFSQLRLRDSRMKLKNARDFAEHAREHREPRNEAIYLSRVANWIPECAAATEAVAVAEREVNRIVQELRNE